jgi:tRNA threonylcarbamoyl adenosine modification protein YeaZ
MLILTIETSSEKSCLLLSDKDQPLAFKALPGGTGLSRNLALEVKNILQSKQPDLIAVGTGPGSYTGIRVGAALAKALAYGWNIPLMGFCSLKAFGPPPVLVDARMGGFYALLDSTPQLLSPTDPKLQTLVEIHSPHPSVIQKRLSCPALFTETTPHPDFLAPLIWQQFLQEGATPLELNYLSHP